MPSFDLNELRNLATLLSIQRPIVGIDVETTGVCREQDRVVQIGCIKVYPDGKVEERSTLINPLMAIPPESTAVHGITDEKVTSCKYCETLEPHHSLVNLGDDPHDFVPWPTFAQVAKSFAEFLYMVDFVGYNVPFDVGTIQAEFARVKVPATLEGRFIDPNQIMQHYHRRNLEAAIRMYLGDAAADEFAKGAHNAAWDIQWTMRLVTPMLDKHPELPRTVEALHVKFFETPEEGYIDASKKFSWRYGEPVMNFGKHQLTPLKHVPRSYWDWMLTGDFLPEVMRIAKDAKDGKFPVKEKEVKP